MVAETARAVGLPVERTHKHRTHSCEHGSVFMLFVYFGASTLWKEFQECSGSNSLMNIASKGVARLALTLSSSAGIVKSNKVYAASQEEVDDGELEMSRFGSEPGGGEIGSSDGGSGRGRRFACGRWARWN